MSVTIYDEKNPHPGGFVGIRVARCVGGEPRQRYFRFLREGRALALHEERTLVDRARALDQAWKAEQEQRRRERELRAAPTARAATETTVRGIRFVWLRERKRGRRQVRITPAFEVSVHSAAGHAVCRRFRIPTRGYRGAWSEAVRYLARQKAIDDVEALIRRMPPERETLRHGSG